MPENVFEPLYDLQPSSLMKLNDYLDYLFMRVQGGIGTKEIDSGLTSVINSKAAQTGVDALTGRMSTAETNITQNANAITLKAAQTYVDNALAGKASTLDVTPDAIKLKVGQIGGENLIKNSTGVFGTTNWIDFVAGNAGDYFAHLTTAQALVIVGVNHPMFVITALGTSESYVATTWCNVLPDTKYTVSILQKTQGVPCEINWLGNVSGFHSLGVDADTALKTRSVTFTTGASDTSAQLRIDNNGGIGGGGAVWFGEVMLQQGEKATAWQPAANEIKNSSISITDDAVEIDTQKFGVTLRDALNNVRLKIDETTQGLSIFNSANTKKAELQDAVLQFYSGANKTMEITPDYFRLLGGIPGSEYIKLHIGSSSDDVAIYGKRNVSLGINNYQYAIVIDECLSGTFTHPISMTYDLDMRGHVVYNARTYWNCSTDVGYSNDANYYIYYGSSSSGQKVFIINGINTPTAHGFLECEYFDGRTFAPANGGQQITIQKFTAYDGSRVWIRRWKSDNNGEAWSAWTALN